MNDTPIRQIDLQSAAKQVMIENGFEPEFSPQIQQQLTELRLHPPQGAPNANIRDMRNLLWSSIDNDSSRDLDQAEVAERLQDGETKILVGIADVDAFVPKAQLSMRMLRRKQLLCIRASAIFPCYRSSSLQTPARCLRQKTS